MRIELSEVPADTAMHPHDELWVRAVTSEPIGPNDFDAKVIPALERGVYADLAARFRVRMPCKFEADLWLDEEEAREGFEQWWIFPKL